MNGETRVLNALQRKEVDRIPTFEWSIDKKVINGIYQGTSLEDFIYKADLDAIITEVDYKKEEISPGVFKDEWGNIIKYTNEDHPISEGCIKTLDDFKKYEPPDPAASHRFDSFENNVKKHNGKKALILHLNDVLTIPRNLLGYENLFINIAINPELINKLVELSVEINIELAKIAVKKGAKIVFLGDDYAYEKGLLMSPKSFDELFYPSFKKVIKGYKDLGLLVIKHTDGNIWSILEKLIDSGIDCIDPIDPTAGMSISEVKNKYGNKVAIKGNVDCANTLSFGTVEQVINETKACIRDGAPGYGYILSSSNSIHSAVKPENYSAMLDTLNKYGHY
jgi:uroporphyrinogen decarboxylase